MALKWNHCLPFVSLVMLIIPCWFTGATHQFGPQKGLKDSLVEELEQQMSSMEHKLRLQFPNSSSFPDQKGAGAAGGIGYGLSMLYQVQFVAGSELVSSGCKLSKPSSGRM